ncbi:glycosyl hydrolase family 88, partial [Bacteroidales bacterium OttesenSCG-928-L03]|nr:glycosyl hydrolase family 88 [Bacteroidales bacterium OttesenSCG-928-L03]
CVTDLVDDVKDIHPSYKWIVAERLANWALAETYQQEGIVYRNPIYKGMKIEGDNIIVEFDQVGSGLTTRDGKAPDWFQVKAKNGIYTTIKEAVLEGNKVILPKKSAAEPVVVRFGWDEIAMPNLMNKEGLPVLPFRTGK